MDIETMFGVVGYKKETTWMRWLYRKTNNGLVTSVSCSDAGYVFASTNYGNGNGSECIFQCLNSELGEYIHKLT